MRNARVAFFSRVGARRCTCACAPLARVRSNRYTLPLPPSLRPSLAALSSSLHSVSSLSLLLLSPLLFVSLSLSLSRSARSRIFILDPAYRPTSTYTAYSNEPRIVRCISRGTNWILKIKKRWSRGEGRPTETSERPRFTGLRGLLFLFCAPAPIRPRSRALSSLSVNARLVIVSAHARISSLVLVLVPVPRRGAPRENHARIRRGQVAVPASSSRSDGFADRARSDIGRRTSPLLRRRWLELSSRETRRSPIRIPSHRLRRPRPCLAELESRKEESGNRRLTGSAVTILRAYLASFCRRVIYARGGSSVEISRPFRIPGIPAARRCPSPNRAILPLSIVGARCVLAPVTNFGVTRYSPLTSAVHPDPRENSGPFPLFFFFPPLFFFFFFFLLLLSSPLCPL